MTFKLSHSVVTGMLSDCAYRVGLKSIVRLPSPPNGRLAAGIAFHAAIEAHERARILDDRSRGRAGDPAGLPFDELVQVAHQVVSIQSVDWREDGLTQEEAQEQAESALYHWFFTPLPAGQLGSGGSLRDRVMQWRPLSAENRWKLWLPPETSLETVGIVDGVYLDPDSNELVVVDNKTANRFGKWRLDGEGQRDQATLYALATMLSPSMPGRRDSIPRFEYHIARTQKGKTSRFEGSRVVSIQVDDVDLEYIQERLGTAHQQQLAGQWPKNPGSWLCSPAWCPFHKDAGGICDPHGPPEVDIEAYRD